MPFISQYTRQSTNADNDLFVFEVNGGSYRSITFANLKASLVSGTAGTGDMVYVGVTPVTAGSIPSFSDTTGFNYDEGYDVGLLVGNIPQLLDVGGGVPGFGIIDGSNLINVPVPDVSNLVTGPASAVDTSLPIFDGATGKIIAQGPQIGTDIGKVFVLEDVGGSAALPAVDGSQLINLPGVITSTPVSIVTGNIVSWGADNATLLDSSVAASQVTTNASGISTNAGAIATNAGDIAQNATDISGKLDKSPSDGIAYMQQNGAIFVPDTSDVDDSTDRRYVLDNDLTKIANLPQDTSLEIGKKQDKSPVDGVLYGLIDGGISPVPTAVGDVVGPAVSVNGEIALFDGITGKLLKTGALFGVAIGDAILLEDVGGNAALPAVDGSQLTNLPIIPSSLQASYDISGQPQFAINGLGALQFKEDLNNPANLILEGLNFSGTTTFSVSGAGAVSGFTFNGVALTILGGDRAFLNQAGSYAKIEDYQLYKFSNSTVDSDPGSNFLRYDNNTYTLVTQIFVSKNQLGGLDIESQLLGVSLNSIISITQRSSSSLAQTWTVTGLPVDATTYVKIPVTLLETTAFTLNNNKELNFRIDNSPALLESLNLEDSSKILSGGVVTIDAPGVPAGESFSVTAGIARIVQPDGGKLDIDFGPFNGVLYTETGEFANLFIDSGGLLDQRDNAQPADFRLSAILGFLARDLTGQLVVVGKLPNPAYQTWAQLSDIIQFISGAADASARIDSDSADTSFQRFAGTGIVFLGNILADINNPNIVSMTAADPTTFRVFLRDGTVESTIYSGLGTDTLIDPTVYDGGATAGDPLIAVPGSNNQSQIFRVFWQPGALTGPEIRFIHGQVLFANIGEALNGLATYFPLIPTPVELGSIDLGGIIVRKGASNFTDQGDAVFFRRSQVAGGGGGSVTQSLQETYSLSVQPQFLINLSQGGVQYKDGTNNTSQTLIEALDFNDTTVFDVNGNGLQTAIGLEAARTGVSSMDGPIVAGVLDTDVNIPAGNGFIVNSYSAYESNSITAVSWLADTTFTIPNLGVDSETFIFVNSSGNIQSQNVPLTETQLSDNIFLGSTINGFILNQVLVIINAPDIIGNTGNSFRSQNNFRGPTQTGGAVEQTDNPAINGFLAFKIGSIEVFKLGINWHTSRSNSDVITLSATDPTTFLYMVQDGSAESSGNTLIDPTRFDNGGVLTVIPGVGTLATIQYVWKLISGNVVVTYGQFVYTDILTASRSLGLDRTLRVVPSVLETYATELAAIIITKQSLDLADLTNTIISQNQSSGSSSGGGATTFLSLTDTPAVAGTENTVITWDASNKLQNTGWSFRESVTGGFIQPLNVPTTGSLFIGTSTNNTDSNSDRSTIVGQNSANQLGDNNDQINIFGAGNMNSNINAGVLSSVFINAQGSFNSLAAGSSISGIGNVIGNNLQAGTRVSIFGSNGAGSALVNATDVHIYGRNIGPAGTVSDYVDFHSTIKLNTSSNTVIIGGAVNVPTANTQFSMSFDSSNQVIRLNRLNQPNEDAHTSAAAEFWYNTTLNKYRGNDSSGIFSFVKESELTFLNLSDTPGVPGTVDTVVTYDSLGDLQNTGWSFRESATGGFIQPLNVPITGSIFIGTFANDANSNSDASTVIGQLSAFNLGDNNDQINIFGAGNMNAISTTGVLSRVFMNAQGSFASLAAGTDISGIGSAIGNSLTAGTRVSIFGSINAGSALVNATDVHIYGKNSGPAGTVSDYVDFHSTIKLNTASNTVIIGGAVNVPTANTQFSMSFDSSNQVIRLNRLNQTSENAHTPNFAELWFNTTLDKYRIFENSEIREILSIDTPGAVDTVPTFDANGFLKNTTLTSFTIPTGWFLNDASIGGTDSLFFGFFTNNSQSNSLGSTVVGQNSTNKLGDNNNNITSFGRQNLNAVIADGVMDSINMHGQTNLQALTSGNDVIAMGNLIGSVLTTAVRSSFWGRNTGSGITSATDVYIYGHNLTGPAGVLVDYVNLHNTIQMEIDAKSVTIGDADTTKPANTDHSLELSSTTQTLGLNVLTTTQEGLITLTDGDFWYNATLNKYRGRENGVTVTFTTS